MHTTQVMGEVHLHLRTCGCAPFPHVTFIDKTSYNENETFAIVFTVQLCIK